MKKNILAKISETTQKRIKQEKQKREDLRKKRENKMKILRAMTNNELMRVARKYISKNPKVEYETNTGKTKTRTPNRQELTDALLTRVPIDNIFDSIPRIKKKFK